MRALIFLLTVAAQENTDTSEMMRQKTVILLLLLVGVGAAVLCLMSYLIYLCVGRFSSGATIYAEDARRIVAKTKRDGRQLKTIKEELESDV